MARPPRHPTAGDDLSLDIERIILDTYPVFCAVYFSRSQGLERPKASIRASAALGDLRFDVGLWDERPWRVVMRASLLQPDGESYVLPVLDKARLVRVDRGGVLIEGTEVVPRGIGMKNIRADHYPQAWYCVPRRRPQ